MASYVVTGASRGLGVRASNKRTKAKISYFEQYEFLRQLSNDPANTVVGLVRDKAATEAKVNADLRRPNIHILHGDLDNYDSLKVFLTALNQPYVLMCFTFVESSRRDRQNHGWPSGLSHRQCCRDIHIVPLGNSRSSVSACLGPESEGVKV